MEFGKFHEKSGNSIGPKYCTILGNLPKSIMWLMNRLKYFSSENARSHKKLKDIWPSVRFSFPVHIFGTTYLIVFKFCTQHIQGWASITEGESILTEHTAYRSLAHTLGDIVHIFFVLQ